MPFQMPPRGQLPPHLQDDPQFLAYVRAMDEHGMTLVSLRLTAYEWMCVLNLVQMAVVSPNMRNNAGPTGTIGRAFVEQLGERFVAIDRAFSPMIERGWTRR